jgi:predicted acylesterase/phospholipase RssA
MGRLRLALTLSGAVSLGAFEGGALAALLLGLETLEETDPRPVVIDAIGGASAGSMTGLLTAWILLQGADPVELMREAWVTGDALNVLRARDTSAPLSSEELAKLGDHLFRPVEDGARTRRQRSPIRVAMALAALRGLAYRIARLQRDTPIDATTFMDWKEFEFHPEDPPERFTQPHGQSPVEFSLASGANALGFPPVLLDRAPDEQAYLANGVINFPPTDDLWYTDGGTIDNEPIGRTIGLANEIDARTRLDDKDQRLHLLIHPHPTAPATGAAWADPANPPNWTHTLVRAMHVGMTQSIYDDLHRMEKTNSRLKWRDELLATLRAWLQSLPADGTASRDLVGRLDTVLREVDADRRELRAQSKPETPQAAGAETHPTDDASPAQLFDELFNRIAGLADKRPVTVEVISPLMVAKPGEHVEDLLAGEFLSHFGGFLDEKLRMSDFVLGYRCMLRWMENGLEGRGLDPDVPKTMREAAAAGFQPEWNDFNAGKKSLGTLGWHDKLSMARLVAHIAHVVEHDVRHWDKQE